MGPNGVAGGGIAGVEGTEVTRAGADAAAAADGSTTLSDRSPMRCDCDSETCGRWIETYDHTHRVQASG